MPDDRKPDDRKPDTRPTPPVRRRFSRADLEAVPSSLLAEIVDNALYTYPPPGPVHQSAVTEISTALAIAYDRQARGEDGFWVLPRPVIEIPEAVELCPDIAAWSRRRLADRPEDRVQVIPDWVCEVISSPTRELDANVKFPFYARIGVAWAWIVDLERKSFSVFAAENSKWVRHQIFYEKGTFHPDPFPDVRIDLRELWAPSER